MYIQFMTIKNKLLILKIESVDIFYVGYFDESSGGFKTLHGSELDVLNVEECWELDEQFVIPELGSGNSPSKLLKEEDPTVELSFGFIMDKCNSWDNFCYDTGLNPYFMNEGLGDKSDKYTCKISTFKKHGVL